MNEYEKNRKLYNNKTLPENIEYYKRCITRFQKVINSKKKKLFIHTSYKILGNRYKFHTTCAVNKS